MPCCQWRSNGGEQLSGSIHCVEMHQRTLQ